MPGWSSFFSVTGSASAALLGLLFVSISINAPATLGAGEEHSKRLAEQALQNYLAALLVSLLALIPDMSPASFGKIILAITILWIGWVLLRLYQGMMGQGSLVVRIRALRRHIFSLIAYAILLIAALRMVLARQDEGDLVAVAVIALLFSATRVCWQFLLRIARTEAGEP